MKDNDISHFMEADSYFHIGKAHMVCEDYARAGTTRGGRWFAMVADGCSSSPDTDLGARLLVGQAESEFNILGHIGDGESLIGLTRSRLGGHHFWSPYCLDATLLAIYEHGENLRVSAAGDGTILIKYRDGSVEVVDIDYKGAPGYLNYLRDPFRFGIYLEEGYGTRKVSTYVNGDLDSETDTPLVEGGLESGSNFFFNMDIPKDGVELIMVCTDGIHSFTDAGHNPVPMWEVIPQLMGIKNYTGDFVKRRVRRFLNKTCPKLGWSHSDDLGVAAIHVPERSPE